MNLTAKSSRRGRRPKGGALRSSLIAKMPSEQAELLIRDAQALGLPITDYLALLIYQRRGWEIPAYITEALAKSPCDEGSEPTLDLDLAS